VGSKIPPSELAPKQKSAGGRITWPVVFGAASQAPPHCRAVSGPQPGVSGRQSVPMPANGLTVAPVELLPP
jgi:hypothetical protein